MAWEKISKCSGRGGNARGKAWSERPCVAIGKTVISFNKPFQDLYAGGNLRGLFVFFDEERRAIGFKVPTKDQIENGAPGWYTVGSNGKRGRDCVYINGCKSVLKRVTDCIGQVYKATMNPEDRIIEVVLSPSNQVL